MDRSKGSAPAHGNAHGWQMWAGWAAPVAALALGLGLALFTGCGSEREEPRPGPETALATAAPAAEDSATAAHGASSPTAAAAAAPVLRPGDPARGRELATQFECGRCHDGLDVPPVAMEKHCFHCHQDVLADKFKGASSTAIAKWKPHIAYARDVPSLLGAGRRYDPAWIERFLLAPYDLRPLLRPTMPRLALDAEQARDLAAYVTRERLATVPEEPSLAGADLARGRKLIEEKGCGACHSFTGVAALPEAPPPLADEHYAFEERAPVALAPDLRNARDQLSVRTVYEWIANPKGIKDDTPMPKTELGPDEIRDLTAYVLRAPLEAAPPKPIPARLPVLERRVGYQEVSERVLGMTCRHCHSDPDIARGDGGAGNTGGFGFKPRGLNLKDYESTLAGALDDQGERRSIFAPLSDGTPRLLGALLARQAEEAGQVNPEIRGMPLGLPALPPEDIQIVESWIAQGRPR